ncbi:MAG: FecR domain-containing protein [Saprospiraceae bacterium]|nr:FecR domain-containing protein [Saprospiraceae bacterium]
MQYSADIDERIARHLAGETGPEEQGWLTDWLEASAENRRHFEQMQQLWQQSLQAQPALTRPLDVAAALAKTKARIEQASSPRKARRIALYGRWLGLAAAVTLLLAAIWFLRSDAHQVPVLIAADREPLRDTLPDGTLISLNRHSSLRAAFAAHERKVQMHGEAYFEGAPDPKKPLLVDVHNGVGTVVGTRFNIDNRSDSSKVIVSVEEGKVKVQVGGQTFYLAAGEQAVIDCQGGQVQRSALRPSGNVSAWANRLFVFDETPLSQVIPLLESTYGVRIRLSDKVLENCRLHTRFNDEAIENIMLVIAETFSLKLNVINGDYYLEGQGCGE